METGFLYDNIIIILMILMILIILNIDYIVEGNLKGNNEMNGD